MTGKKDKGNTSRRRFVATVSVGTLAALGLGQSTSVGRPKPSFKDPLDVVNHPAQSWVEIGNQVYGAKAGPFGSIGGGKDYANIITGGDFQVTDAQELWDALTHAKAGQVIFIPSEAEIDLTTYIYIEQAVLEIPEGVTLAGDRGHNGSQGGLIVSNALNTPVMIRPLGSNVRITGLRIQGPNPKRHLEHHRRAFGPDGLGREYYYRFPVSRGIVTDFPELEIDNCEISAFSHTAISLTKGKGHKIHHNHIHQCQYNGLGYGVSHSKATSVIEYNLFNENRHSIAGTGVSGCGYIARHNIETGISLSHCFDMHGGRDRKDGTQIAGTAMEIYNNTFRAPERAVVIRGVPEEKCEVYQNWFVKHQDVEQAVRGISDKTIVFDNAYGKKLIEVK